MNLIVMAHKLEARHFFSNYTLKKHPVLPNLYEHESFLLYICHMGVKTSHDHLVKVLESNLKITQIINLGIAGAINNNLELEQVYSIKKVIDASENYYDLNSNEDSFTCYSSEIKILTSVDASELENVDLIDMEAFGLCKASNKFNIPFVSYKLISDFPLNTTNDPQVKADFNKFSKLLFEYYKKHIIPTFLGA